LPRRSPSGHSVSRLRWAVFCFFHNHTESHEFLPVHLSQSTFTAISGFHFDKTKTLALARVAVYDHLGAFDRTHCPEPLQQIRLARIAVELSHKKFHFILKKEQPQTT
jgi:hypothetical protein